VVYPDLAERLQSILHRLIDLEEIVKENIYHPEFRGSFSIKKVLPALVPELSYSELEINNGDTAIARFARMAKGEMSGDEAETTRRQLLEYCAMDTYAMVKLHEVLIGLSERRFLPQT
jgi:predicted RecB family nuclease